MRFITRIWEVVPLQKFIADGRYRYLNLNYLNLNFQLFEFEFLEQCQANDSSLKESSKLRTDKVCAGPTGIRSRD